MTTPPPTTALAKCLSAASSNTIAMPFVDVDEDLTTRGKGGREVASPIGDKDIEEEKVTEEEEERERTEEIEAETDADGSCSDGSSFSPSIPEAEAFVVVVNVVVVEKCIRTDLGLEHIDR